MKKLCAFFACAVISAAPLNANELELSFSDDFIDGRWTTDMYNNFSGQLALMHIDFEGRDTDQLSYTYFTRDEVDNFNVMLGGRVFYIDSERDNGYGVALGLGASTNLTGKFDIGVDLFYAPDIVTGGDIEDILEIDARVNFQLLENASLFAGYRKIEADPDGGDYDVYDDPYIGIRFEL